MASNVLIGDDDRLVLADFGQSRLLKDDGLVQLGNLYPSIRPPEAIQKPVGGRNIDIYQFGVLLYSMFNYDLYRDELVNSYGLHTENLIAAFKNGDDDKKKSCKEGFKKMNKDIKEGVFPNRDLHHFYVPKIIQRVIKRCLEPAVEDRYNTFGEIQDDLNKLELSNDVFDLRQDFAADKLLFQKDDKPCEITIIEDGDRYKVHPKKNGQNKNALKKENLTRLKLADSLLYIANNI
jgi:serine/threonine protein kinase